MSIYECPNYEYVLWILVGIMSIVVVVLLCIHFVVFVYGDKYERLDVEAETGGVPESE